MIPLAKFKLPISAFLLAWVCLCTLGCSSSPKPYEESYEMKYRHSAEYMKEQIRRALKRQYDIESEDEVTGTITTKWDTNLAVMSTFGFRRRLIVDLKGDTIEGYNVAVQEEKETNDEQKDPLSQEAAVWKPVAADGVSAAKFRTALERLLNPSEKWKRDQTR